MSICLLYYRLASLLFYAQKLPSVMLCLCHTHRHNVMVMLEPANIAFCGQ